ncbi:MAG: hypothetical protein ACKO3N_08980 [Verrucomicrobiota bacterium]
MTSKINSALSLALGLLVSVGSVRAQCPDDPNPADPNCPWNTAVREPDIDVWNPVTQSAQKCKVRVTICYRCCKSGPGLELWLSKLEFEDPDCARWFGWFPDDPARRQEVDKHRRQAWEGIDNSVVKWGLQQGDYRPCFFAARDLPDCTTGRHTVVTYFKPSCYRAIPGPAIASAAPDPISTIEWCGTGLCVQKFAVCHQAGVVKATQLSPDSPDFPNKTGAFVEPCYLEDGTVPPDCLTTCYY